MAGPKIYSSDDHLDLNAVSVDLWETRLPSALVDRGPRVVRDEGTAYWMADGKRLGLSGAPVTGNLSAITRAGIEDDGFRASDPKRRLEDMDLDGIEASVIYGPSVFGLPIADADLKAACYAAFNDWAVEFNAHEPDRLCLLARLPGHDPIWAAAELERCVDRGHRGAILEVFGTDLGDGGWERLWAVASDSATPISFHLAAGTSQLAFVIDSWRAPAFATVAPMQLDEPFVTMVFSGALERHPGLKLVLAESGVGWLPYLVARMDHEWTVWRGRPSDYELRTPPSELFRRQVLASFEEEPLGRELIPLLGADNVMWASDYPHPDSTFPHSLRAIDEALGGLGADAVHRIVAANCAGLYRFRLS